MTSQVVRIPAATGGYNTDSAIDAMPETDATIFTNLVVEYGAVKVRKGFTVLNALSGTSSIGNKIAILTTSLINRLVVAGATAVSYVSSGSTTVITSGLSGARWSITNFKDRLWFCQFSDFETLTGFFSYDGTTWAASTFTLGGPTFDVSYTCAHNSRLYCIVKTSNVISLYYGGVNSVTGTLTNFDVSGLLEHGGYIVGLASLGRATGAGDQSQLFILSSKGEFLMYSGTDPGDSSWTLVRRGKIPAPIVPGRYCDAMTKYKDDLLILTIAGVYSLNSVLSGTPNQQLTKASSVIRERARTNFNSYGWQIYYHALKEWIIINMPISDSSGTSEQLILDLSEGGATYNWTGINAYNWVGDAAYLYFVGGINSTNVAIGYDNTTDGGTAISWELGTSWSLLQSNNSKRSCGLLPVIMADAAAEDISIKVETDLRTSSNSYSVPLTSDEYLTGFLPIPASGKRFRCRISGSSSTNRIEIGSMEYLVSVGSSK